MPSISGIPGWNTASLDRKPSGQSGCIATADRPINSYPSPPYLRGIAKNAAASLDKIKRRSAKCCILADRQNVSFDSTTGIYFPVVFYNL